MLLRRFYLILSVLLPLLGNATPTKLEPYFPPGNTWTESGMCMLGNSSACLPISRELLGRLDECAENLNILGSLENIGALLIDNYAEDTFFQELAHRSAYATECQVSILKPKERPPLLKAGWAAFDEMFPLLHILEMKKRELQREHDAWNLAAADPRTAGPTGITARRKRMKEQIASIDQSMREMLSQIPFGSQLDTQNALMPLLGLAKVSEDQFAGAFDSGLNAVSAALTEARDMFVEMRNTKTGQRKLDYSQKVELYNSPAAQEIVALLDPHRRSLGCLFDSCYRDGPRNAKIASIIALLGATILTAGSASPFLIAATTLGATTLSAAQIQNSCFKKTTAITGEVFRECSSYALAQTTLSQVDGIACATDIALASLELVPGVIAAKRLLESRRLARLSQAAEREGVQYVRTNADGSVVTRAPDGRQITRSLNGRKETVYSNGTREVEENGVVTISYTNGMRDVRVNGVTTSHLPDGTAFRKTYADGRVEELFPPPGTDKPHAIIVTAKKKPVSAKLESFREAVRVRNLKRYTAQHQKEFPNASAAEARAAAQIKLAAKEKRISNLHKQCTAVKPNAQNMEAGKIFARYGMGFAAANTLISYTMATWNQVKDEKWAASLGYEVASSVIFSYISSRIFSKSETTYIGKVTQGTLVSWVNNMADALVHQGLFSSDEEAREAVSEMAKAPDFTKNINALVDHMESRTDLQEFTDGIGDMSNNVLRAITGKEDVKDLSAAEVAALKPESLKDPIVQERLLDLIDDKLYAEGRDLTTGSSGLDRLSFNTVYGLGNIPVQTAIGMATFYAVCMNIDNPVRALAAFGTIQFVRGNLSGVLYYNSRKEAIGQ